jgi:glycosyltransferase involved in cell wall biosynthesis
MSVLLGLTIGCAILALIPLVNFSSNLWLFRRLPANSAGDDALLPVSVLIPARNEASVIARAMHSVLANEGIDLELIVLDDHSTDDTAAIAREIARSDERVCIVTAPPLPDGWCGKQHGCWALAQRACHDTLLWIDADVELSHDAIKRMARELNNNRASLISGFPFQRTGTWLETFLIPLMHFILLGFLPLGWMRTCLAPAFGAGCGQLFMARRKDYFCVGGHAAIRASLHDGIALPRAFRRAGKWTDVFDAGDLAECRMYDSAGAVWKGLLKNAGEGIATPAGIVPWTVLLLGGQIVPPILAFLLLILHGSGRLAIYLAAIGVIGIIIRFISADRFYHRSKGPGKYISALAHPIGVLLFLLIQWHSMLRRVMGRRSTWKGRSY